MEDNVCKTCGGSCKFCKVVTVVGPLAIIGLTWYNPSAMWAKITTTVVAVIIAGTAFCPCKKGGVASMGSAPAAKTAAKVPVKAAAKAVA